MTEADKKTDKIKEEIKKSCRPFIMVISIGMKRKRV